MKDIKSLYNEARKTGNSSDISAYQEAIQTYLECNPYGYISNLEYIITSDIGANTLKEFVETNGLPIACYNDVMEVLEKAIHKCDISGKDSSSFKEAADWLSNYRKKYLNYFMMYEYYTEEVDPRYIETYYSFNDSGIQGRKLPVGMINNFGESVIADVLITCDSIGGNVKPSFYEFCEKHYPEDSMLYEWLSCTIDDVDIIKYKETTDMVHDRSLSAKVNNVKSERQKVFRESVITGSNNIYECSEDDIENIKSLIAFKEYQLTWADEMTESSIMDIQHEIYDLYEELASVISESDADLVDMLPGTPVKEGAPWIVNTRNKKTGSSPTYIDRNHDMAKYGEDDDPGEVVKSDNPDMSIDDYKRPSAGGVSSLDTNDLDDEENNSSEDKSSKTNDSTSGVQNYYYYTYNNSLNKNSNSFNRDNSSKDDHSIHKSSIDSSTGKHVNSHNNNVEGVNNEDEKDFEGLKESSFPWELDVDVNHIFTERFLDGKNTATYRIKKLPKRLADIVNKANKSIRDEMKDISKYDDEKRLSKPDEKKLKEYLEKMKSTFFFNEIGFTSIKVKNNNYRGEIVVIPDLTGKIQHSKVSEIERSYDHDGSVKVKTSETKEDESSDFIKQFNIIIKAAFDKYKESNNPDCDDYKLKIVGNDGGKSFKYIVISLSNDYAKKLFDYIKHPKDNPMSEAVGDADDMKPESDHPIKDILTDIDRATVKKQQEAKKKVQDIQNVGRAAMKPVNRTKEWIGNMIGKWKDADETNIKEKMADPHARSNLFTAIKKSITAGSLLKAGLLLNPVFLFLTVTRGIGKNKREFRIRNEMIGEIKTEISIIDEKIKDADSKGDNKAKYQLMRFKNELNKKLLRVGGGKRWAKLI